MAIIILYEHKTPCDIFFAFIDNIYSFSDSTILNLIMQYLEHNQSALNYIPGITDYKRINIELLQFYYGITKNYTNEIAQLVYLNNHKIYAENINKYMPLDISIRLEYIYACALLTELSKSQVYRKLFLTNLNGKLDLKQKKLNKNVNYIPVIKLSLKHNIPNPIDYKWGYRCNFLVTERQHLDNLMSWLSTLGGGFSALGDYDLQFAIKAEATSFKQMKIAFRLGDQTLISRCWLYYALSLIQKQKYKKAAVIIMNEYKLAISKPYGKLDWRLTNMCQGIWTKLKYERQQYKLTTLSRRL